MSYSEKYVFSAVGLLSVKTMKQKGCNCCFKKSDVTQAERFMDEIMYPSFCIIVPQ